MKFLKTYFLFVVGAVILFSATIETLKNPYLYIVGIVFLMLGLFNISRTVKSNSKNETNETLSNDENE